MFTVEEGMCSRSEFLKKIYLIKDKKYIVKTNKNVEYYNIPSGFDIETSSFYENGEKRSLMYVWMFGIFNYVTYGRTWCEFISLINEVIDILELNESRRLVPYIHNLPYEFQFIRKRFEWDKVFILSERKPVYAITSGIEFRCSLKLSGGKSLEKIGEDLQKYKVRKAVGNLDYDLIRTPETKLTDKELKYCENDIRVILSYIQEKIEQDGDITKIPLTNTGYVRNYCRKECYKKWRPYRNIMDTLTIEVDEYNQLKRAFQGGFVHANARYSGRLMYNVRSYDFTSSYPAVMVLEKFPMSNSVKLSNGVNGKELNEIFMSYNCVFDIEIFNLIPKLFNDNPISKSKCWICEGEVLNNGRIVMASHIGTTITEQDFFVYREFYEWDRIEIKNLRIYKKNYLPKRFVLSLLGLYEKKTTLKGVEEEAINYMISKNMMNAAYGMTVTDPMRDEIEYRENEYFTIPKNLEEGIDRYNKNIRRFLFYPWGVWVTAYARANLFSGIIECGRDYVYSDTDSIKSINTERHLEYFQRYNENILSKIEKAANYHGISQSLFSPKTIKGKVKTIGLWDDDGEYEKFKTLGAKRYLTYSHATHSFEDSDISVQLTEPVTTVTIAGSHKLKTAAYLRLTGDPFSNFSTDLVVPKENSGRLILTYIDEETEGDIKDYLGVKYHYNELSSVHMEKSEYNLSISDDYEEYIEAIQGMSNFGE